MSTEYWLVSEAVPYFAERLGAGANLIHGARMFQLLFAGGWEPTRVHYSEIPDAVWSVHRREAMNLHQMKITFSLMPMQTRLPDKLSIPQGPEDSMIPVMFFAGDKEFVVPLTCEIDIRNNGREFLDVSFDHTNDESPYRDAKGNIFEVGYECGGEELCEYVLPSLSEDIEETDFDDALQEFLFDRVSANALKMGMDSFYRAWGTLLAEREQAAGYQERFQNDLRMMENSVRSRGGEVAQAKWNAEYRRVIDYWGMKPGPHPDDKHEQILNHMHKFMGIVLGSQPAPSYQTSGVHVV